MISKVTLTPAMSGASAVTLHDPANNMSRFLSKIDGVAGPPAPRDVVRVRPGVDGAVDQTLNLSERNITLEGELFSATAGASLADLSTLSETFYSTMLSPARLELTWENGTVRWCNVKLAGPIETTVEGNSKLVAYQVQLRAADPRWYEGPYATSAQTTTLTKSTAGTTWTATSSSVSYTGTAPSPLTIAVTAPSGTSLTLQEVAATVPTAYGSLINQTYTSSLFTNPSMSIVGANAAGTGTSDMTVAANTTRTFYSQTRSGTSLEGVSSKSEFPFMYPGSVTFGIAATGTNTNGSSVSFTYYRAYW